MCVQYIAFVVILPALLCLLLIFIPIAAVVEEDALHLSPLTCMAFIPSIAALSFVLLEEGRPCCKTKEASPFTAAGTEGLDQA